nr:NAD(P)-dependent oxidoreductase [Desulfobacula sp.]
MKILVTGATGFIGNHLIPELIKSGNEIVATGSEDIRDLDRTWLPEVHYIRHNINDGFENGFDFFLKPDKLIHLCWPGLPNYKGLFHFEVNLFSSYAFIKNLVDHGLKDVSVIGTCFEYGMKNGPLTEDLVPEPANSYGLAKDSLRRFLEELNHHIPFSLKWIRLFYIFGKGQNKNSILEQLKVSIERGDTVFNMSGGEQIRDYLPVEKAAEYISKISLSGNASGIYNCCSGQPISIRNLVENFLRETKKEIKLNLGYYPYPDYEPMAFWGDVKKLKKLIGEQ